MNTGDISQFSIDNHALEDNEEIKLIYTSHGPDYNRDLKYYIHLIAVSQQTGDTVNILTTAYNEITDKDKHKVFNFFSQDNLASKFMQMDMEDIKKISHVDELNDLETKTITKVARDPEF